MASAPDCNNALRIRGPARESNNEQNERLQQDKIQLKNIETSIVKYQRANNEHLRKLSRRIYSNYGDYARYTHKLTYEYKYNYVIEAYQKRFGDIIDNQFSVLNVLVRYFKQQKAEMQEQIFKLEREIDRFCVKNRLSEDNTVFEKYKARAIARQSLLALDKFEQSSHRLGLLMTDNRNMLEDIITMIHERQIYTKLLSKEQNQILNETRVISALTDATIAELKKEDRIKLKKDTVSQAIIHLHANRGSTLRRIRMHHDSAEKAVGLNKIKRRHRDDTFLWWSQYNMRMKKLIEKVTELQAAADDIKKASGLDSVKDIVQFFHDNEQRIRTLFTGNLARFDEYLTLSTKNRWYLKALELQNARIKAHIQREIISKTQKLGLRSTSANSMQSAILSHTQAGVTTATVQLEIRKIAKRLIVNSDTPKNWVDKTNEVLVWLSVIERAVLKMIRIQESIERATKKWSFTFEDEVTEVSDHQLVLAVPEFNAREAALAAATVPQHNRALSSLEIRDLVKTAPVNRSTRSSRTQSRASLANSESSLSLMMMPVRGGVGKKLEDEEELKSLAEEFSLAKEMSVKNVEPTRNHLPYLMKKARAKDQADSISKQ